MITVTAKSEPGDFDAKVRQPGAIWLRDRGVTADNATWPQGTDYPPFWSGCSAEMLHAYGRVCAYAALYIEKVTGAPSTDHFYPKSKHPFVAYEWLNYRLACMRMNSVKHHFEDVLDPFSLPPDTFRLQTLDGELTWAHLGNWTREAEALDTVTRLGLNEPDMKERRCEDMESYRNRDWSQAELRKRSPFVFLELQRQGLL